MVAVWLLGVFAVAPVQAESADQQAARAFANDIAKSAIAILTDSNLSESGKQNQLENLFSASVDLDWVARFVLGKHWRSASEAQREAYVKHYKEFIVRNFTSQLGQYSGQTFKIEQVIPRGEDGEYLLTLTLLNKNEPPIYLDYRVRKKGSGFLIFDIIIEGVSLITTQRSEFNSVVSSKGLDYLIEALKSRSS